jgi:protein phosphatase
MHSDSPPLYCSNPSCQSPNPVLAGVCQRCGQPLERVYLWVVGAGTEQLPIGHLIPDAVSEVSQGRYLAIAPRLLLDTKPALLPEAPLNITPAMEPYLRLSHYKLAIPQVYGVLHRKTAHLEQEWLLLENAPIVDHSRLVEHPHPLGPLPSCASQWATALPLRQLNWLWQMASLWTSLAEEGAASSLLHPENLRVEGALVRLLELTLDRRTPPTVVDLGKLWQEWFPITEDLQDFLSHLYGQMTQDQISMALVEQRLAVAVQQVGRAYPRQIAIATQTDQGPTRQRNEDACFPVAGTVWSLPAPQITTPALKPRGAPLPSLPLVVVCDGIGGHEGGNVASGLAIANVQAVLQQALPQANFGISSDVATSSGAHSHAFAPGALVAPLDQAVRVANDAICQRNDQEKRQERQRMGTTLVMAVIHAHELYLTHVGDSRVYRITHSNCHQVTLDDDLASRESRLGYALYRYALQQPSAGALIQALGMATSAMLHPNTQRFVLDEDCLFLLCSDGLSDNELVDRLWQSDLLPVLAGAMDVEVASQRLIALANQHNGHDNVTVGLIHCRVSPPVPAPPVTAATVTTAIAQWPDAKTQTKTQAKTQTKTRGQDWATDQSLPPDIPVSALGPSALSNSSAAQATASPTSLRTQIVSPPAKSRHPLALVVGILGLWIAGGLLAYHLLPEVRQWVDTLFGLPALAPTEPSPPVAMPPSPAVSAPPVPTAGFLSADSLIQVNRSTLDSAGRALPVTLRADPTHGSAVSTSRLLPVGTVLKISSRQTLPDQVVWLKIQVCSVPDEFRAGGQAPSPGTLGWIEEREIVPLVNPSPTVLPAQHGACGTTTGSPASPLSPTPTGTPPVAPKN